jgi:hypothetical protein
MAHLRRGAAAGGQSLWTREFDILNSFSVSAGLPKISKDKRSVLLRGPFLLMVDATTHDLNKSQTKISSFRSHTSSPLHHFLAMLVVTRTSGSI